jgi:MFS transporter, ACS family, hexuronate transporter
VPSRRRWIPISFLFAGGMINYLDRAALSVAAPLLLKDLQLDRAQLGIIFSSFFAGYTLFTFVGGYASDVFGPKRVLSASMTAWSVFCGLTAAAAGFLSLLFVRVLFGCGEGPFAATANKMISNWFPPRQSATAIGMANAGTPLGGALASTVAGSLALRYGWRTSFVILSAIGLCWTLAWSIIVADRPAETPHKNDDGRHAAAPVQRTRPPKEQRTLSFYLRQPTVVSTGLAFFSYSYVLYFFLSWFPTYLTSARHIDMSRMTFLNAVPWVLGTAGLLLSGLVCDLLARACRDPLTARKSVLIVCLVIAAGCVSLTGLVASVSSSITLMALTIFCIYLTGTTYWAIIQDVVVSEHVGAAGGFVHLLANCAGIVAPVATGFIAQASGSFTSAFLLAGAVALFGALIVGCFLRRPGLQQNNEERDCTPGMMIR